MTAVRQVLRWIILVWAIALTGWAAAQDQPPELPEQADVRIIVDISGSMKETDPDNLRRPAVRLLAGMLPEDSRAGLWTFGQYVNMLIPHSTVDSAWRDLVAGRSEQINSVALHTNLGLAIEKAADDWLSDGTLENTHLIILSDGKVDIPGGEEVSRAEERRILEELLPELRRKGATIHTVGLSELADKDFLRQLARDTGGSFLLARTAEALNRAFADTLNAAVPQEQVPIEGDRFSVDSGVREFTALIFSGKGGETNDELALSPPGGTSFGASGVPDNVRWAQEEGYDLITVTAPAPGSWRILGGLGQGSRVTVVSDLRMTTNSVPSEFDEQAPFTLEVAFYEDQQKITDPVFLDLIQVSLSITAPDGRQGRKLLSGDQPPEDGVYRDTISRLPATGRYQVDVIADGGTFSRKFSAITSFTEPGDEAPPAIVSEPMVQDLSKQVETLESEPKPEPEPELNEPKPEPEPEPEPEPAPSQEPVPVDASPTNQAPVAADEKGALWGIPVWMYGAAAAALVLTVGFTIFAIRQKKARAEAEQAAAKERETANDVAEDDIPVVTPEPEPEPEQTQETEHVDDTAETLYAEQEQEQEQDLGLATELESDPEGEQGSEFEVEADTGIPEVTETIPVAEELAQEEDEDEDNIPVADDAVETDPAEETDQPEEASDLEDEDDEFGLEDFDLSEFDDLPDFDSDYAESEADGENQDKSEADEPHDHKDQKK